MARRRRTRLAFAAAALLGLVLGGAGFAVRWSSGPGLDREADRFALLLQLRPGMTVADIGAGEGRMAVHLARRLDSSGHMYTTEIEGRKMEAIRKAAGAAGLTNITVLAAGEHSTNLPDACCEVIYLRRVYHHLADAASIDKSLYAALRPGGRLGVIDMLSPRWMFWFRHGIPADVVVRQISSTGFVLERRVESWSPIDYCLIFRKPPRARIFSRNSGDNPASNKQEDRI